MELKTDPKYSEVGPLPEDWEVRHLSAVADFANGKPHEGHVDPRGSYLLITLDSIGIGGRLKPEHRRIGFLDGSLARDDIVIILSDIAHGNLLGLCDVIPEDNRYVLNQRVGRIRVKQSGSPHFLRLQINRRQDHFKKRGQGTSQRHIYRRDIDALSVPYPPISEQRAIAETLSHVDAFIGTLDKVIAKRRDLKQAGMQQLLTGQTRLPGFSGEWEVKPLSEVATVFKGTQLRIDETNSEGLFAHFNGGIYPSSYTDKANAPSNTIAISEGGNSCGYVQFIAERFWCGGHCYAVTPKKADNHFLYHALKGNQAAIMGLRVGSGLPNVQKTALKAFELALPKVRDEQVAIAAILSDMDAELAALEARRDKTRALKRGMMQELLTGRIRLA